MTNKTCSLCGASKRANARACNACLKVWECIRCGQRRPHGAHGWCKPCQKAAWRAENPEHKDHAHAWYMAKKYSITPERYQELLEAQGGVCATCKKSPVGRSDGSRRFHVDHDHACCPGNYSCGKCVRGILCYSCNQGLGCAKDDIEILRAMVEYLETWYNNERRTNQPTEGRKT